MTNGKQTWIAERIDRSREAPAAKALRSQRAMTLRMTARKTVKTMLDAIDDPQERAAVLCDTLDMVAEHLYPIMGRVEAATAFNARAADICATFRLGRAVKNAAAEHAFARLTKAANDGGET